MATHANQTTASRAPLSRERVLRAAVDLADEDGIESLSMRRLGQHLGVEAMSLYNHVANKDDLLNGIVDLAWSEIAPAPDHTGWKAAVRQRSISAHEVFLRHPWVCTHLATRGGPARLRHVNSTLRDLREAGFPSDVVYQALHALDSHILGFTLQMLNYSPSADDLATSAERLRERLDNTEYRYLLEHAQQHVEKARAGEESGFAFGLDLILNGLRRPRSAT